MEKKPISGDIKAEHSGENSDREWSIEYQTWLYPGDHIVKLGEQFYLVNARLLS